jgi:hypothetical protein
MNCNKWRAPLLRGYQRKDGQIDGNTERLEILLKFVSYLALLTMKAAKYKDKHFIDYTGSYIRRDGNGILKGYLIINTFRFITNSEHLISFL